jgi:hypothetical protein
MHAVHTCLWLQRATQRPIRSRNAALLAHAAAKKGKQQRREKEDDESSEDLGDNVRARAPASRARASGKVRAVPTWAQYTRLGMKLVPLHVQYPY